MPEERPIVEEVLDYAIYAPVGLLLSVTEDLPELVRKGRSRIEGPVRIARFVGALAAKNVRHRLENFLDTPTPPRQAPADPPRAIAVLPGPDRSVIESAAGPGAEADASAVDRAIRGYRSLAASQVVARLGGLTLEELATVRDYEEATRRRRTILNRIVQLEHQGRDEF